MRIPDSLLYSDPLFQQALVEVVRENPQLFGVSPTTPFSSTAWSGLPVVFDEVFTGLYRLGRRSSGSFLDVHPDISVHAKLLTGGLVPLCTTLASDEIFEAFYSPNKADALLHGHSYTAHPVGCQVGDTSLKRMRAMERNGYWTHNINDWKDPLPRTTTGSTVAGPDTQGAQPEVWSSWSQSLVYDLSHAESVESIFALGSILSITLRDQTGGGKC